METATEKRNARVERGQVNLIVPYNSGELVYVHPRVGSNTYREVGSGILKQGLLVPTGDYAAPLVHSAYCDEKVKSEPEFKSVRETMENTWLWVFNRNGWTDKGVYVSQDLEAKGLSVPLDVRELEKSLKGGREFNGIRFSEDGRVRFAPKELYVLGNHTPGSLSKDGFIIASFGKDGAEKIGEVSFEFRYKPKTFGLDIKEGQNPEQRVSALSEDPDDDRLRFLGDFDGGGDGDAFGVRGKAP